MQVPRSYHFGSSGGNTMAEQRFAANGPDLNRLLEAERAAEQGCTPVVVVSVHIERVITEAPLRTIRAKSSHTI
jgi:hypothetical protein